jgi:hypothetical protein
MPRRWKEKRDSSLRRPTHSQERMRKKKSACSVRNDGSGGGMRKLEIGNQKLEIRGSGEKERGRSPPRRAPLQNLKREQCQSEAGAMWQYPIGRANQRQRACKK